MSQNKQYNKYYITLNEEDKDFGLSAPPKGTVRFEIRDNQCSVELNVSNLKTCAPGYSYKCFLIYTRNDIFETAFIGNVKMDNHHKGSLKFSSLDSDNTEINPEKSNIIALAYLPDNGYSGEKISFPLVGYRGSKIQWKNRFSFGSQFKKEFNSACSTDNITLDSNEVLHNKIPKRHTLNENVNNSPEFPDYHESFDNFDYIYTNHENTHKLFTLDKIKNLKNMLSMSFSLCKPFNFSNDSNNWWKIQNHQLLNRILYSIGYPSLILSNNHLNSSFFIYGYYIVGINDKDNINYFTYGIPSLYGIDLKPQDLSCLWKSENNTGELYGEFGYWMIKLDLINEHII